jgi:aryl-alcohol dehydrogenase-like predicted oxidoreductase
MSALEFRTLGRTGLSVSALGYGAMELRGEGHVWGRAVDPTEADKLLNRVLDRGINFIDTSPDYGESEEAIGRGIGRRRDEFLLATKSGCPIDAAPDAPRPLVHDYRAEHMRMALEHSLRVLRTDHIDVLQFHASPAMDRLDADGSLETMQRFKDEGKIRFIGMSGTLPNLREHIDTGAFDVLQIPYSAVEADHEAVIAEAADDGAGILVRGGVAQGSPDDTTADHWRPPSSLPGWLLAEKANLDELADGLTLTQFMLRLTLSNRAVASAIVATLNPDHLDQNVAAASLGALEPDVYAEARRRLADAMTDE